MAYVRLQYGVLIFQLFVAMFVAAQQTPQTSECPKGTVKIGEKRTENADVIIVQPLCKKIPAVPTECPPGSSVVGSACMRDTFLRPQLTKEQKLAALRLQSRQELDQVRYHGFLVSWEGIWTILSRTQSPEASSTAEDESNEMREHVKRYLELQQEIEDLTGGNPEAKHMLAERQSHIYVRTDGHYDVNLGDSTGRGENYVPDSEPLLKATQPISDKSYAPGDVPAPLPLKDKRTISPNGPKPGEDPATHW